MDFDGISIFLEAKWFGEKAMHPNVHGMVVCCGRVGVSVVKLLWLRVCVYAQGGF